MIKVGVIGFGRWGPNLARNFANHKDFDLVACADILPGKREAARRLFPQIQVYDNTADFLEAPGIDAVAIATPANTHYDIAVEAISRRMHVLVEKPTTLKSEETEALSLLAIETKCAFLTDFILLYSEPIKELSKLAQSGELGQIVSFQTIRDNLGYFRQDVDVIWDLVPHELSVLDAVIGGIPHVKWCSCLKLNGFDKICTATVSLEYPTGAIGEIHVSWFAPEKMRRMVFCGNKKMAIYDDLNSNAPLKIFDRGVRFDNAEVFYRRGKMSAPSLESKEALKGVCDEFRDRIVEGRFGDARSIRLTQILEEIQKKAILQ